VAPPEISLLYWDLAWGVVAVVVGFFLIGYRWRRTPEIKELVDARFRPFLERIGFFDWDWRHFTVLIAIIFAIGASLQAEPFPCGRGTDDVGAFVASGHNFWIGASPFNVSVCNSPVVVPYGIGAVALNAVGSLGGRAGVWAVWLAVALLLIPATWRLAGPDRRYMTYYLCSSILFVPIVTGQIDGASNAIVPLGLLLPLVVTSFGWVRAGALSGLISTARFPSLVPFAGATAGAPRNRLPALMISFAIFLGGILLTIPFWGNSFIDLGLIGQANRVSFSLNEFGVLFPTNWVSSGPLLTGVQAVALALALGYVYMVRWPPIRSATFLITVLALTTQFLSFNFLIWLVPIALLGGRPQRFLYAIGLVGGVDYSWALAIYGFGQGIWWPSEIFAALETALLVGLLWTIARDPYPVPRSDVPGPAEPVRDRTQGTRASGPNEA
jgi:hypothetical protein